ncbi:MAG: hypothetical protein P1Q69_15040 [Candidatus Thorarchaeota archaeon]|nr:hypothetical protein [Candidatus Thorarchaeota archaeon]
MDYYSKEWLLQNGYLEPNVRQKTALGIIYTKNYYYEATWVIDDPPIEDPPIDDPPIEDPPIREPLPEPDPGDPGLFSTTYMSAAAATTGHWEYGPTTYSGGTYEGTVQFSGGGSLWTMISVHVVANSPTLNQVDSIALNQTTPGGIYVQTAKVDGVWQEPVTGRNPTRTGGMWTDACTTADYEYDSTWPVFPGVNAGPGTISSNGEYITITDIPTGTSWHGPSFVNTLPSYFRIEDMGSFSANLSVHHHYSVAPASHTSVNLYDANEKIAVSLAIVDYWNGAQASTFIARYFREDGSSEYLQTPNFVGDVNGIVQIRYDPLIGIIADAPGMSEKVLHIHSQINGDRLIKYVAIQSYRYSSYAEQDERIYSIWLSYASSEFTAFNDNCLDQNAFYQDGMLGTTFVKEDAEDGDTASWSVYDNDPQGTVTNELIDGDMAIRLLGGGWSTGYRFPEVGTDWNAIGTNVIEWSVKYSEYFTVHISVDTNVGHRYLMYTCDSSDALGTGEYIHFGLSSTAFDGRWHTFQRDLQADLKLAQPTVTITDVNAFLIRGSGYVDDIKLMTYLITKEDAEDGRTTGWDEYSGTGNVYNVLDGNRRVIQLSGSGTSTGYRYPYSSSAYWNDPSHLMIEWSMKYSEYFVVYVSVDTSAGHRYIYYIPVNYDDLGAVSGYVHHGLGSDKTDGMWHTYQRDLLADLRDAEPTVDIIDVNAILIRGSGYIDDIKLLNRDSSGEFLTPAAEDYMYFTNLEARGSLVGWHGSTYVHPLNRPFRLYQLSEFSVDAVVDQVASNRMGMTYVGMYDENQKCVMWIYMGDAWAGSTKGFFGTVYYPESGGSFGHPTSYIYTDFTKTGTVWYDQTTESIKATVTGAGTVTLAAAENPARVIKYVVLYAIGYQAYPVLNMQLHDIDVVADLNAPNPNAPDPYAPVEYDGTVVEPSTEATATDQVTADDMWQQADSSVQSYWTAPGFWPLLNIVFEWIPSSSVTIRVWATVDLLGNVGFPDLQFLIPELDGITENELVALNADTTQGIAEVIPISLDYWDFWAMEVAIVYEALSILSVFMGAPGAQILWCITLSIYVALWMNFIYSILRAFYERAVSGLGVLTFIVVQGLAALLLSGGMDWGGSLIDKALNVSERLGKWKKTVPSTGQLFTVIQVILIALLTVVAVSAYFEWLPRKPYDGIAL